MKLYVGIVAEIEGFRGNGGNKVNDWAHAQADKLKKALKDKLENDAKFNECQRIKREQGRDVWDEVRKQLSEQCDSVNREMGDTILRVIPPQGNTVLQIGPTETSEVRIQARVYQNVATFVVKFKGDTGPLQWESENGIPNGKYELNVQTDGKAAFYAPLRVGDLRFSHTAFPASPESIAQNIISEILDSLSP